MGTVRTTASVADIDKITGLQSTAEQIDNTVDLIETLNPAQSTVTIEDLNKIAGLQSTAAQIDNAVASAESGGGGEGQVSIVTGGIYYPPFANVDNLTYTVSSGKLAFSFIKVSKAITVTAFKYFIKGTLPTGKMRIVLFGLDSNGAITGDCLAQTNEVDLSLKLTNNEYTENVTANVDLLPGVYAVAACFSTSVGTMRAVSKVGLAKFLDWYGESTYHPLKVGSFYDNPAILAFYTYANLPFTTGQKPTFSSTAVAAPLIGIVGA